MCVCVCVTSAQCAAVPSCTFRSRCASRDFFNLLIRQAPQVCVCACVRACMRVCVRACMRVCVRASVCVLWWWVHVRCHISMVSAYGDSVHSQHSTFPRRPEEGQRGKTLQPAYCHLAGQPLPAVPVHHGQETSAGQLGHCPGQRARGCLVDPVPSLPAISDSVGTPGGPADSTRWVGVGPEGSRGFTPYYDVLMYTYRHACCKRCHICVILG